MRTKGATYSVDNPEKFCAMTAVEDALMVLAISRTTPGAVSCKLMVVMSTSSGGLSSAVTASPTLAISSSIASPRISAGNIVMSIETVAKYVGGGGEGGGITLDRLMVLM